MLIGLVLMDCVHAQNPLDNPPQKNDLPIDVHSNPQSHDNVNAKEIEKKGGFHMMEIIVVTMCTMNVLFMFYCCIKEKTKGKQYHVVSSDEEFQFDQKVEIVKLNDIEKAKEDHLRDIIQHGVLSDVFTDRESNIFLIYKHLILYIYSDQI